LKTLQQTMDSEDQNQIVKDTYFDSNEIGSYASLYSFLKNNNVNSVKDLEDQLLKLKTYAVFKPVRKTFERRRYLVQGFKELWNIDLLDMQKYFRKNKSFKYILVIIEALSKKAYCRPLKNKTASVVLASFQDIIKEAGYFPKLLHSDRGSEFKGVFKKYLDQNGVKLYHSFTKNKAILAERFCRTLRSRLNAIMSHNKNKVWHLYLDSVIKSYNNTPHSRHKLSPNSVTEDNQFLVWRRLYKGYPEQKRKQLPSKLQPNDIVKIANNKLIFEKKSATQNYTTENFRISRVEDTVPWTYKLVDEGGNELSGGFLKEQLLKVNPGSDQDDLQ